MCISKVRAVVIQWRLLTIALLFALFGTLSNATPFTTTVPGTGVPLPAEYPQAGGVAIVLTGANGNIYYQFSDPSGAFVGFQNTGTPTGFRGNPFTINNPIALECGVRTCADYFGGSIARIDVRFSAYDGDTQVGGFDFNDITLVMNGYDVGNWSDRTTDTTNDAGTVSFGQVTGFGNNTFNTGWFSSTNRGLLDNILTTLRTTTQVRDRDPNDNYWDFTRGPSLADPGLRTIAPGYEIEKTRAGGGTGYLTVGQNIIYDYIVRNIGSVDISNITVFDDKIGTVTCSRTNLARTVGSAVTPNSVATCQATYRVTQQDIDSGVLTNVATLRGTPEFGSLGARTATVTLTGPTSAPALTLEKIAVPQTFTGPNQTIRYDFTVRNTGNTTLTNVVVTDPKIPGLSCTIASISPLTSTNTNNRGTCSGTYLTTQADVDAAAAGTLLTNTATVRARDPNNTQVTATSTETVSGPAAVPTMTVDKATVSANFTAKDQVIPYTIRVTNTGNVTWPNAPTVTDSLGIAVTCPTGRVAPGAAITCAANYLVTQADVDRGNIANTATASITVNGVTRNGSDTNTINAVISPALTLEKTLLSGPNPFSSTSDVLVYQFKVRNTGNVTLNTVTVTDNKVAPNCPVSTLAPGAELICQSANYTVTQADLNAGQVANTASVTARTPANAVVGPVTDTETVPANQMPALSVDKTASPITALQFVRDAKVTYTYVVTNTGNVQITAPITISDSKFPSPIACPAGALNPGATRTCTAVYTITATDAGAGFVTNTATARSGTTTSPPDEVTIPQDGEPELTLQKIPDAATSTGGTTAFAAVGDTIGYIFRVTNVGGTSIDQTQPITISDPKIGAVNCAAQPTTLFSTAGAPAGPTTFDCTGSYTVTQADINAGSVLNTATASFPFNRNGTPSTYTSPQASATVPTSITPAFTLTKTPSPATFTAVGQPITFTFAATNSTAQQIAQVVVSDPKIPALNCTLTNLGPAGSGTATKSCTAVYTTTQADMDLGSFNNTATGQGTSSAGVAIPPVTATATVTRPTSAVTRAMTLTKRSSTTTYTAVGNRITYTMDVRNTGNVTLTNVIVTDPQLGTSCTIPSIAPNTTNSTCIAEKIIAQADIDAGSFVNTATATAAGAPNATGQATVTGPSRNPGVTLSKVADAPFTVAGDTVTFTMTVRNTGNVTLTGVTVTDTFFTPNLTCTVPNLAPGASDNSCTGTYNILQSDVDRGSITNTASVSATGGGQAVTNTGTATVPGPIENPSVLITKVEDDSTGTFVAGGSEGYTITVRNTGNVTLKGLRVTDALIGLDCPLADLLPGLTTNQCLNSAPLTGTKTITQADVDRGSLINTASVTGTTTRNTAVADTAEVTLSGPEQLPALTMTKTATSGANYDQVGDIVTYDYVVRNAGNITLTGPIRVADDKTTVTCTQATNTRLAPNATINCAATYRITQQDLDAGQVLNRASASVTQSVVPGGTYPNGSANVTSPEVTETVSAMQIPAVAISKRVLPGTPSTYDETSDVITFQFTVRNTGNVTTTSPIVVNDPDIGAPFDCAAAGLAPGASATCTGSWSPLQADIDTGSFTNTATASTQFAGFGTVPAPNAASATVTAVQKPQLITAKEFVSIQDNIFAAGKQATYRYTVENTGNQTVAANIDVVDNLIGTISCSTAPLAPGDAVTCFGVYTVTVDDVQLGSVTNTAYATSPTVTGPPTFETIPNGGIPALTIAKTASINTFTTLGELITYTYTVTNTSTGSPTPAFANDIFVRDDKLSGPLKCFPYAGGPANLLPGQSATCTAPYLVSQPDLDAVKAGSPNGFVTNNAVAETIFNATKVGSVPAAVTVEGTANPALTVTKTATGPSPADLNDTLTYTITVRNTGNQTVSGITVEDPMLAGLTCNGGAAPANLVLAPTQSVICTGTYVVKQADIDAQILENIATATGANPQGAIVTDDGSVTHPLVNDAPEVTVLKELSDGEPNTAFSAVGQVVSYKITVTNSGNVTLNSTSVTDVLFPGQTRTIGPLAPGESDSSAIFDYTVTQADIDRGFVNNSATAVSVPNTPDATPVRGSDDITGTGPDREPTIVLTKTPDITTFSAAGDRIPYTYIVANTGNVTLTAAPAVADDKIGSVTCDALPAGGLLPNAFLTCRGTHVITQTEVDQGFVTNVATVTMANPVAPGTPLRATQTATVNGTRSTSMVIDKKASISAGASVGEVITYTYDVTNTGNVTLTNVVVTDAHTSASGLTALTLSNGGVIPSIPPGQTRQVTATYRVTQADIDTGADITNIATANGTPLFGFPAPTAATDNESVAVDRPAGALTVIKTASAPANLDPGQDIVFTLTVRNAGNVTLDNIALRDTLTRLNGTVVSPSPIPVFQSGDTGNDRILSVGEVWTYQVRHTITQADVDAGGLRNSATATGDDPFNTEIRDVSDNGVGTGSTPTTVPITPRPALNAVKSITTNTIAVGGRVRFEIAATNTGNVTLTGVNVDSDILRRADGTLLSLATGPSFFRASDGSGSGTLKVGETAIYRATYVLTQADVDAGGISNAASVRGTPPTGSPVRDQSDDGDDSDGNVLNDPTVLTIPANPALRLRKRLDSGGPTYDTVGDVLRYSFTVTNTGNVTLTQPVTVADPLITGAGGTITCGPVPLAPRAQLTCTGEYAVTQADIDQGSVINSAVASSGPVTSNTSRVRVPAQKLPALETVKTAEGITVGGVRYTDIRSLYFVTGAVVDYSFTVTNTGNTTLTDTVRVTDNLISNVTCPAVPATGLAPGGALVCTGVYTVTPTDVRVTSVTNVASATSGTTTSPLVSETVPADGRPVLDVTKALTKVTNPDTSDAGTLEFDEVGDVLTYGFTVTNAGTLAFANPITIVDTKFASPIVCYTPSPANPDFVPTEVISCEATYTVTQADLDAGQVVNEAYAQTTFGDDNRDVVSDPVTQIAPAASDPMIAISKSADPASFTRAGQVLTYTLLVENTGNQTLTSVVVDDPLLPSLTCEFASLVPGENGRCVAPYTVTQDDVDAGEVINTARVDAVTPRGAGIDDTTRISTPGPAAAPGLLLTKTALPTPFGAPGSAVTYLFTLRNTGNVTLTDLVVTDAITTPGFVCNLSRLDVGATDDSCSLSLPVSQAAFDAGEIVNTANATAFGPGGTTVRAADTVITPAIAPSPALEATKTARLGGTVAGSVVTFDLTLRNTGDVTLDVTSIADTMKRKDNTPLTLTPGFALQSGDTDGDGLLDVGEAWRYTASYVLTLDDVNAGGIENTVTANAVDPFGTPVLDVSDNGEDGDGNTTNDPTVVDIVPGPAINAVKTVRTPGSAVGDAVVFAVAVTNIGNVSVENLTIADTLTRADGTDISSDIASIVQTTPASPPAGMAPGDVWVWDVTYVLTQADIDAGGLNNVARASATGPGNVPVADTADNGDDTDGNLSDDPTILTITPSVDFDAEKIVVAPTDGSTTDKAGDIVNFDVTVRNNGNVTLTNFTLTDTMTNLAGTALIPDSITLTAGGSETSIAAGTANIYRVAYALTQDDVDAGGISNQVSVSATTPSGIPLIETSDNGDDTDGNVVDDPTVLLINAIASVDVTKVASIPERATGNTYNVTFTMTVENTGNVTQRNLSIVDDLTVFVAPARLVSTTPATLSGFDGTGTANAGYNGTSNTALVTDGVDLAPGAMGTLTITVTYDVSDGSPAGTNTVVVNGDTLSDDEEATARVIASAAPAITATKTVTPSEALLGGTVSYRLTFENTLDTVETNLTIIDDLPSGVLFTPGTARLNGADVEPVIQGRQLRWSGVTLAAGETAVVTFDARVTANLGEMVNRAYMRDANGTRVSNVATATLVRRPEAVFDCGDVIGKVFDDRNFNGYQDGVVEPDRALITDQTYDGSKGQTAPEVTTPDYEPGLPSVRLATVTGTIITTDQYGRFSVPCAELPADIGSNFTLKLDERSLPTGYRVTTENPRVIRLTAGTVAKLNFGAALGNVVDIDLVASAFTAGSADPTAALIAGVDQLMAYLRAEPSVLRLSYYMNGEGRDTARARLDTVEALVRDRWRDLGLYQLRVERTIRQLQ